MSTVLLDIISRNKDTEIGKKWQFQSVKTVEDYRNNVPLTNYEDYRPYVERMVEKGEENLLTVGKVVFYYPTSGTTSKSKLLPQFVDPASKPIPVKTEQALLFNCWHHDMQTPLGVPIIPGNNATVRAYLNNCPSAFVPPPEAYRITDFPTAIYVQMVFGLKTSFVKTINAVFCPTVLNAFILLAQEWEQMTSDIRNGTLKPSLNLTDSQRVILEEAMGGGDPHRADQLVAILSESKRCGDYKSVAHQLWPSLMLIIANAGGSFATYIPQLQHYLGDKIRIGSPLYVATEGMFGVNKRIYNHVSAYTLLTNEVFFEFIPLADADSSDPKITLLAEEIKMGEVYEIVVTTSGGLYRYRMGDLIKVLEEGTAADPPVIDVLGRKNLVCGVYGEKVSEYQLTAAITAVRGPGGPWNQCSIQDYLMTANIKSVPPTYQLWIELSPVVGSDIRATFAEGGSFIDKKLAEMNTLYAAHRVRNIIGPLSVLEVAAGTFTAVKNTVKKRSLVTKTQLKIPHITDESELINVLEGSVVNQENC